MTCQGQTGKMTMTMTGSYEPQHYEVHTVTQEQMPGGQAMNMAMTVTSHRVGDCTASQAATMQ